MPIRSTTRGSGAKLGSELCSVALLNVFARLCHIRSGAQRPQIDPDWRGKGLDYHQYATCACARDEQCRAIEELGCRAVGDGRRGNASATRAVVGLGRENGPYTASGCWTTPMRVRSAVARAHALLVVAPGCFAARRSAADVSD